MVSMIWECILYQSGGWQRGNRGLIASSYPETFTWFPSGFLQNSTFDLEIQLPFWSIHPSRIFFTQLLNNVEIELCDLTLYLSFGPCRKATVAWGRQQMHQCTRVRVIWDEKVAQQIAFVICTQIPTGNESEKKNEFAANKERLVKYKYLGNIIVSPRELTWINGKVKV